MAAGCEWERQVASIDIVVPCYQYARFLRDCVTSVLTQDIQNLRVLVIDDASGDNSAEIAAQLASEDPRVEVSIHRSNRGHIATYNEGIDWVSSDYFLLLSADDLLPPGSLLRAISVMEQHRDISFVHGGEVTLYTGQPLPEISVGAQKPQWRISTGREFIEELCRTVSNPVSTSTAVVRTTAQKSAGHYCPKLPHSGDMDMWLRLAMIGRVGTTAAAQGIRRTHESNMSASQRSGKMRDRQDFLQREAAFRSFFSGAGSALPDASQLGRRALRNLADQAFWSGIAQICLGYARLGFTLLKFSFKLAPINAYLPPVSYLLRTDRVLHKIGVVVAEAAKLMGKGSDHAANAETDRGRRWTPGD